MNKKLIITETDRKSILNLYGLINEQTETPVCSESGCSGTYRGPEFVNGSDVAHQYSNTITKYVASKLKELHSSKKYVKVDLKNIKMITKGMGSGNVEYYINIPFVSASDKCDAMTGFAHVGGWGHTPALNARKSEILSYIPQGKNENVVLNNNLYISPLIRTPEGLQEYWIQWKHKDYQSDCDSQVVTSKIITFTSSDLSNFLNDIKTSTRKKKIDLNSIDINVDNFTFKAIQSENGSPIEVMVLTLSTKNEGTSARDRVLSANPGAKIVKQGKFENDTRDWHLIMIPQQ